MLSKYRFFINGNHKETEARFLLADRIEESGSTKGTLGITEISVNNNKKVFIKSHLNYKEQIDNINKEYIILKELYEDQFKIEFFKDNDSKLVIMMDYLYENKKKITINDIQAIINNYQKKLNKLDRKIINYNQSTFKDSVIEANKQLYINNMISLDCYNICNKAIDRFDSYCAKYGTVICHGDLSNSNIRNTNRGGQIVIDWEDAMINVKDYDLLYWLTFFSQREYYSSEIFDTINIDKQYGKDIMLMIIVAKSHLSYMRGNHLNDSLSFDDRLKEIINL